MFLGSGIPINLHLPQLLGGGTTQSIPVEFSDSASKSIPHPGSCHKNHQCGSEKLLMTLYFSSMLFFKTCFPTFKVFSKVLPEVEIVILGCVRKLVNG